MVELDIHGVDLVFSIHHRLRQLSIHLAERLDCLLNLRLHQSAHFHDAGGNRTEFAVELGGKMFIGHDVTPQPKRPVM